jgi:hypothetical protein
MKQIRAELRRDEHARGVPGEGKGTDKRLAIPPAPLCRPYPFSVVRPLSCAGLTSVNPHPRRFP